MKKNYFLLICIYFLAQNLFAQAHIDAAHAKLQQQYEYVSCFDSTGIALIGQKSKFGYLDKTGKVIVPFIYENGNIFREGKAAVQLNGKWGFVDNTGKEIIPFVYDEASAFVQGITRVRKDKQIYWLNEKGHIVDSLGEGENFSIWLTTNIQQFPSFPHPWRLIYTEEKQMGIKEIGTERIIFPPIYDYIRLLHPEYPIFLLEGKESNYLGNANTGNTIPYLAYLLPNMPKNENEEEEEETEKPNKQLITHFAVQNEQKEWGILDMELNEILPFSAENTQIEFLNDSLFWLMSPVTISQEIVEAAQKVNNDSLAYRNLNDLDGDGSRFGINSRSCDIKNKDEEGSSPDKQVFNIISNKMGVKHLNGKWLVEPKYNAHKQVVGNFTLVYRDAKWHLLDLRTGAEKYAFSPIDYHDKTILTEDGYLRLEDRNGFVGMKDPEGNTFLPFEYREIKYDAIHKLIQLLPAKGLWGMIDKDKNPILPFEYISIEETYNPDFIRVVGRDTLTGFVNPQGKFIIPPIYSDHIRTPIFTGKTGIIPLAKNGKWGAVNEKGEEIIPFIYDQNKGTTDKTTLFVKNQELISINDKGKVLPLTSNTFLMDRNAIYSEMPFDANFYLFGTPFGYGFMDADGKMLIPFQYAKPSHISKEGWIGTYDLSSQKMGLADTNGKIILPPTYSLISHISPSISHLDYVDNTRMQDISAYRKVSKMGKIGLIDKKGKEILPCIYDEIEINSGKIWIAQLNDKKGMISPKGKIILPFEYDNIKTADDDLRYYDTDLLDDKSVFYFVKKSDKNGLINANAKFIFPPTMQRILLSKEKFFVIENAKYAVYNIKGKQLLPEMIDFVEFTFCNDLDFWAVMIKGEYQILTKKGVLLPDRYAQIYGRSIMKGDKRGLLSKSGKQMIAPKYDMIFTLEEHIQRAEYFIAENNHKYGILDSNEQIIIPFVYDSIAFEETAFMLRQQGKWGKMDTFFRVIVPPKYDSPIVENVFQVGAKKGFLNEKGEEVTAAMYDDIEEENGYVFVRQDKKQGVLTQKGEVVFPTEYSIIDKIDSNIPLFRVCKAGKWGVLDAAQNPLLPLAYTQITSFKNGFSVVQKDNKCGVVDSFGKLVLPVIYDGIELFEKGFSVKMDCKYGFFDTKGKEILPVQYDMIAQVDGHYDDDFYFLHLWQNNLCGFYDFQSQNLVKPQYKHEIMPFYKNLQSQTLWLVRSEEKRGLINNKGEIVVPIEYELLGFQNSNIIAQKGEVQDVFSPSGEKLKVAPISSFICK